MDSHESKRDAYINERLVSATINKDFDTFAMVIRRGKMERFIVVAVASIDVGMSIKKDLDTLMVAFR